MRLQYNFPISDLFDNWSLGFDKKKKKAKLLHVIEELEAVAKFSELREKKSKTQYVILGVIWSLAWPCHALLALSCWENA